jgi:D-alanine-D-alanine ligase
VTAEQRKIRVAVVFGGRSTEHAISCVSAGSILGALDRDQFDVVPVGITPEGRWVLAADDPAALEIRDRALPQVKDGTAVVLAGDPTASGLVVVEPGDAVRTLADVDLVFPVLHGAYGEDGTIQGLLEMAGLPYVGAGVFASAAAMDKEFTKKLLAAEGLPVGEYTVLRRGEALPEAEKERLGLPVFVKPARAGSSFGISRVTDWADLDTAVAAAREIDPKVLVEAAVVGREVECGVLEGENWGPPEASLPAEIRVVRGHDWYDFEAKYLDDACEFDLPADLTADLTARLREMACAAFTALDGAGLARVDFFVRPDGELVINEVNTMPGFTPISMFPRMWAATGMAYPDLLTRLIRVAVARGTGLR